MKSRLNVRASLPRRLDLHLYLIQSIQENARSNRSARVVAGSLPTLRVQVQGLGEPKLARRVITVHSGLSRRLMRRSRVARA